jgi:uncharacterized protein
LLGFIGAGGAGVLLGVLSGLFGLDIDKAIGTSIAAMCFVTVFGAVSHYREGNVVPRIGAIVGSAGIFGAIVGAELNQFVSDAFLRVAAGLALWVLAALVWIRTRILLHIPGPENTTSKTISPEREIATAIGLGASGGLSAGFLGVGMAPYLQLGFLTALRLNLRETIGTTMLTLVFTSAAAAIVLARHGDISTRHLVASVVGLSAGSFVGAKMTGRAPLRVLRTAVIAVPVIAGAMVLFL